VRPGRAVLSFIRYPDPRLTAKAELREGVDDDLREIGERLLEAAREAKAYGLAAAHMGEIEPVVVISGDGVGRDYLLLFNPQVTAMSDQTEADEEGSVSLPGVRVMIERPLWAEISYMDAAGQSQSARFERFAARVALHEIEQMNGVFFLSKLSRLKREMVLKKARKLPG
ncbi:MAG TPA: peptide deformylase, partial [Devosia sp.]|nr:peptide deformylase [Devosia sp.]